MTQHTQEDRLFFLTGQVEELIEVTQQQQEIITALIEQSVTVHQNFIETTTEIEATAKEAYRSMMIEFLSKTKVLPVIVGDMVNENIKEVLENTSATVLDEKLGEDIAGLKASIAAADDVAKNSIENLNKWIRNKLIALWLGTFFIAFMSLALIAYFYVPSMSEIAERKAEYHRYSNAIAGVKRASQPTNNGQNNLNPWVK